MSAQRIALVTGAGAGIGAAITEQLRRDGLRVFGLDLTPLDDTDLLQADVSDPDSVANALQQCGDRIDVLVNNAGILIPSSLAELDIRDLDRQMSVNVRGPFIMAHQALPLIPTGGCIVNVCSELALLGREGASAYAATKGALLTATRSWARELAPNVRVNAVAPGPVDTALLGFDAMSSDERALETANPMRRIGRVEEIAAVVGFLASPAASFVTGQCYGADGGAAMH